MNIETFTKFMSNLVHFVIEFQLASTKFSILSTKFDIKKMILKKQIVHT